MYVGAQSNVCVNNVFSESFRVTVIVHQGSVLSPFLFSIVMEARECKTGCPWELLYEDDLVIESKGLRVNMGKTKIMCSGNNASGNNAVTAAPIPCKWPCGVCSKGVGSNSIFYETCQHWIHKCCTDTKGRLKKSNADFKCLFCYSLAQ